MSLPPFKKNHEVARSTFICTERTKECIIILLPFSWLCSSSSLNHHTHTQVHLWPQIKICPAVLASWQISLGPILFFFSGSTILFRLNAHSLSLSLSLSLMHFLLFHHTHARRKTDTQREKKRTRRRKKSSLNEIRQSNNIKHYICFFSSSFSCIHIMTPRKSAYPFLAQVETLLIYGIFLFLTGLAQICVTISHRYIIEKTIHNNHNINILRLLPVTFTIADIHLWYIYPSATFVSLERERRKKSDHSYT